MPDSRQRRTSRQVGWERAGVRVAVPNNPNLFLHESLAFFQKKGRATAVAIRQLMAAEHRADLLL